MDEPAGQGESGTASGGIIVRPGEGRTIPGTDVITLVATTEQTGGSIGVFEDISSPGEGPTTPCSLRLRRAILRPSGRHPLPGRRAPRRLVGWDLCLRPSGAVHAYKVIGTERGKTPSAFIPGGPERAL